MTVLMDGGIRSGLDVLKALSSGAKACLLGRAWAYGLAAKGEAGVTHVLDIIRAELATAMALTGCTDIRKANRQPVGRRRRGHEGRGRRQNRNRQEEANRMSKTDVTIKTRDGDCPAYVFTPAGRGPGPR